MSGGETLGRPPPTDSLGNDNVLNRLRKARPLAALLLSLALSAPAGCGFRPRGELDVRLPDRVSPMYVELSKVDDPFRRELRRALVEAGVGVADEPSPATTRLQLTQRESRTQVLAVDSSGKAVEYDAVEAVSFTLLAPDRSVLVPLQRIVTDRPFTIPAGTVLGKEEEEEFLRRNARQDLIGQILRRLRAQLR
jgi:outer membrane lipopolysaccharide assembly protein LptE/RlpB